MMFCINNISCLKVISLWVFCVNKVFAIWMVLALDSILSASLANFAQN